MKNLNPRIVKILDERNLKFKCKVCGKVWYPTIKSAGRLARNSWECPNGCKGDYKKVYEPFESESKNFING